MIKSFLRKYNSLLSSTLVVACIVIFISIVFIGNCNYKNLKNRGVIKQAYIYNIEQTTRSFILSYIFKYDGIEHLGEYSFSYWEKRGERLSYKYYPILVDPENLKNSSLLFFDSDFERYGFVTPDSIVNR